jgi:hypothetical protein
LFENEIQETLTIFLPLYPPIHWIYTPAILMVMTKTRRERFWSLDDEDEERIRIAYVGTEKKSNDDKRSSNDKNEARRREV